MTQRISEEICNICGIEPLELSGCSFKNLRDYGIEQGTDVCEAAEKEDETFSCEQCEYSKVAQRLFPDFGEAENFLKLYNMEVRFSPVCYLVHSNFETTNSRQFLQNLKKILEGKTAFCKELKNTIKNGRWNI